MSRKICKPNKYPECEPIIIYTKYNAIRNVCVRYNLFEYTSKSTKILPFVIHKIFQK